MDTRQPLSLGQRWELIKNIVGESPRARAEWLWKQINQPVDKAFSHSRFHPSIKAVMTGHEWAAFLEGEGMSHESALKLSNNSEIRKLSTKKLKDALASLKTVKSTKVDELKVARTWTISHCRIKPEYLPLHLSDGDKTEFDHRDIQESVSLVLSIALDCLAGFLRYCLREGCEEMFLTKAKKQFCSKSCAQAVAKKEYRKRKRRQQKEK